MSISRREEILEKQRKMVWSVGFRSTLLFPYYFCRDALLKQLFGRRLHPSAFSFDGFEEGEGVIPVPSAKKTVVFFTATRWQEIRQRPQHLASALSARGWKVLYVEPFFSHTGSWWMKREEDGVIRVILPLTTGGDVHRLALTASQAREIEAVLPPAQKCRVVVTHPFWTKLFSLWHPKKLVYDCLDNYFSFSVTMENVQALHTELVGQADNCVITHPALQKLIQKKATLIPNAFLEKKTEIQQTWLQQIPGKKVLYFGILETWFDRSVLAFLARSFPAVTFVCLGPVADPRIWFLGRFSNILFPGEVPHESLASYMNDADVCCIPFRVRGVILYTDPVKIYEMLASGKPIVASAIPGLERFAQNTLVRLPQTKQQWREHMSAALAEKDPALRQKRKQAVKNETWQARAQALETLFV